MNKLLQRQRRKYLGNDEKISPELTALFNAVSESYNYYEKDRKMIERAIELSSKEMIELNNELEIKNKLLKQKNKELEQFAFVASHDLQEPLRTTISFVEILKQQYSGKLDTKADKYLDYILQSTARMRTLVKDLLDFSRIGNNKQLEQLDCNILLQGVIQDIDKAIKDSGAEIIYDELPIITGYSTEIKQLFQNLTVNAVKFRKPGVAPQINIRAEKAGNFWHFSFKDNGIGIDSQHSERIFDIFQRLHTRSEYEGSGIGLSHCKKIVELHNGKIWIESAPGNGSTFHFTLCRKNDLKFCVTNPTL